MSENEDGRGMSETILLPPMRCKRTGKPCDPHGTYCEAEESQYRSTNDGCSDIEEDLPEDPE